MIIIIAYWKAWTISGMHTVCGTDSNYNAGSNTNINWQKFYQCSYVYYRPVSGLTPCKVCAINDITVSCYLFNNRLSQSYHKRSTIQRRKTSTN